MTCDCEHLQGSRDRTREGHQVNSKSGGSIRGEACEHAQSLTHVSPPLSNRFKKRCELVKRSCLANSIQFKKKSWRQRVNLSVWRMRRETQTHSDNEKPKVPTENVEKETDHPREGQDSPEQERGWCPRLRGAKTPQWGSRRKP